MNVYTQEEVDTMLHNLHDAHNAELNSAISTLKAEMFDSVKNSREYTADCWQRAEGAREHDNQSSWNLLTLVGVWLLALSVCVAILFIHARLR